ncbi:MAG TPA: methyltransferase [Planctomycetota bacterium]|nr:methyltransferase [Planctomycetota bacterium]
MTSTASAALAALLAARIGPALAAIGGLVAAAATTIALEGDEAALRFSVALAAALVLPALAGLRRAADDEAVIAAGVRGNGSFIIGAQVALIAAVAIAPDAIAGLAVASAVLLIAPVAWRRARGTAPSGALAAETWQSSPLDIALAASSAVGGTATLIVIGLPLSGDGGWVAVVAAAMLVLWATMFARTTLVIAVALGIAATLGWLALAPMPIHGRQIAAALALAQIPALTIALGLSSHRGWSPWLAAAQAALLLLAVETEQRPPLIIAIASVCLAIWPFVLPWRRPVAGPALIAARRMLRAAEPYWRFYGAAKLRADPIYAMLAADPRRWGRVLDLGCGPGLTACLALGRGDVTAYCGADLDRDKLLAARRALAGAGRGLDERWALVATSLPTEHPLPGPFDTCLILDVLHYWPSERQEAVLTQARALMASDGRLWLRDGIATDGDAGRVAAGERFTTRFGFNPPTDLHFLPAAETEAMLARAGFAVDERRPCGGENAVWICRAR